VIQSFADETAADLFQERNTRAARQIPREIWRVVQRKLKALDVAARLDDLTIPAGNRLERLKGQHAGRHSIRINDQYRVTFRWEQGHAHEVRVEDYHS
jgi:proteic killer suppression protein